MSEIKEIKETTPQENQKKQYHQKDYKHKENRQNKEFNKRRIEVSQTTVLNIIKHFKNSQASYNNETRCSGRLFGTYDHQSFYVSASHAKSDEGKIVSHKTPIVNDNYCIGMYLCGSNTEITESQIAALDSIRKTVSNVIVLVINPQECLEKGKMDIKGYLFKTYPKKELIATETSISVSILEQQFMASIYADDEE